ncbi:MAG: alginate lyase family protein [Bacteroidales bacterium]|jgi:hypothetical protein|nr:alginate lyase family protein [Bacteroidales bacterium]
MKKCLLFLVFLPAVSVLSCSHSSPGDRFAGWDYKHMLVVKKDIKSSSSVYYPAYIKLVEDADEAMTSGPFSVTYKDMVPPGGTKNDYMSQGPYWWPDTTKPDGLPFIRRDGERYPQAGIDRSQLGNLMESVKTLSLAWFFTGEIKYAERAAFLLKVWFLNPETLMNPHLEYAQSIPGITTGRGIGIIDVRGMYTLVDAITLLENSGAIHPDDMNGIKRWFSDFFQWLTTSKNGKDEDDYKNNHSVAYDVIVTGIARFLGNNEYAAKKISGMPARRIDPMIEPDGRQPEELIRTNAFGYSVSNLGNFFDAGETGLKMGVDIFSYSNPEGGSLRRALDFLVSYIGREDDWQWQQIGGFKGSMNNLGLLIRRAARYYNDPGYDILWKNKFEESMRSHWSLLVIPGLK